MKPSKTLAKLANHIAKKQPHFNGVCDLSSMTSAEVHSLLANIGVVEVWGVGRRIGLQLHASDITTVQQLRVGLSFLAALQIWRGYGAYRQ